MLERELDARDNLTVKVYPTRHGRRITSSSFRVSGVKIDNDPDSLKYTIGPDGQSVEFSAGDAAEDGQVVTGTIEGEQEGVDPGVLKAPFSFTIADVNPDGIDLEPTEPQPDGLGTDGGTAGPAPGPGGPETGGIDGTSEPAPTSPGGTGTDGTGVGGAEGGTDEPPPPPAPGPGGAPPPPPPPPQPAPMRAPAGQTQQGIQGSGDPNARTPGPAQVAAPGFRAPNPPPPPPPAPKPPAGRAPGAGGGPRGR